MLFDLLRERYDLSLLEMRSLWADLPTENLQISMGNNFTDRLTDVKNSSVIKNINITDRKIICR